MLASWPVVPVDDWAIAGIESQGQHVHNWLKHPSRTRTWLFKPARPERDRSLGEDIAEKLGSELARLVGVPAAPVELAIRDGVRGALVKDVRLPYWERRSLSWQPSAYPQSQWVSATSDGDVPRTPNTVRRHP
jgi:hypothetical protein